MTTTTYIERDDGIDADHGLVDSKGRRIGGIALIHQGSGERSDRWYVRVQAARDGRKYGAITPWAELGSESDARSHARRQLAVQGDRYRRLYRAA